MYEKPHILAQYSATSLIQSIGEKDNLPHDSGTQQPSAGPGYEADE